VLSLGFDFSSRPPSEPVRVFEGSAREAAQAFPRHFNVAVALSIAGIGFDRTEIEVWADPEVAGAVHQIEVDAEDIGLVLISRNQPSANPRTSRIVAPSILAGLRDGGAAGGGWLSPAHATHSLTGARASCSGCAITSTRVGPSAAIALRRVGSS
jgi:Domain of unknown function DUF108